MTLLDFIESNHRTLHIHEYGLEYYVRKSIFFPGVIELATVHNFGKEGLGLYLFLKKHSRAIPFYMEQVINPRLADYMRKLKWTERDVGGIPQFASPLMVERYSDSERFQLFFRKRVTNEESCNTTTV